MSLQQKLTERFTRHLTATVAGRAHILSQIADAESNGEAQIFDRALAHVDDPQLQKMIEKHKADEIRHAALFRAAAERTVAGTNIAVKPVPAELKMIDRLDRAVGGVLDRPIEDGRGVMEAYLLLQVVEERAVAEFTQHERHFRARDPETADVFVEVIRDEERHLKYCQAIARRYAPSDEILRTTLAHFRAVEERAFRENGAANMRYVLHSNLVDINPFERAAWQWMAGQLQRGSFARFSRPTQAALAA